MQRTSNSNIKNYTLSNAEYGDFTSIPSGEAEYLCKEDPFEEIGNRGDVNDEVMIKIVERREARKPRSFTLDRILSVPLNSDDFLTTGFRSGFRRTRSDQFPSIPPISDEFLIGILRNLSEIFRWKPDRNLLVRKSSEFNGTDRKATEPMGSDAGNDRIHW